MPSVTHRAALLDLLHLDPPSRDAAWFAAVDWDAVLAYASASLAPLVLLGIGERAALVPERILDTLTARRAAMARKRLLVASALNGVCRALGASSVPFIVLKGAALAVQVYPNPVLRPMSDIDLWVPRDRVGDALHAMDAVGFHDSGQATLEMPVARTTDQWRLARDGAAIDVELHTSLPSLAGLPWATFDDAWDAGSELDLGGFHARVLCPEHQLTHVCLHLSRRNVFASGLSHLVDVARIVATWRHGWDWPRMARTWRGPGVAEWMVLTLTLARDLLGAPVPGNLEGAVPGPDWPAMRSLAEDQLWQGRAYRLPSAVDRSVRDRSSSERLRWLRWRLFGYYWSSPAPRPPGRVLGDGLRRIWRDVTVKVPGYLRGWWEGRLRGETLAEGLSLARGRLELERLVAAAQAPHRAADGGPAPGSGAAVATRPEQR